MNILKKTLPILIVLAVLIAGLFYYLYQAQKTAPLPDIQEKQKEVLKMLRGQVEPLSQEELERQKKELDEFREGIKSLTEEEISKQKEELDRLRMNQ